MVRDFNDNEFPLAYSSHFAPTEHGLHGDARGSVNRKQIDYVFNGQGDDLPSFDD
jgi:hypothetical protein